MFLVYLGIYILVTADAALAHLLVGAHIKMRKILLAHYDIEAHAEHT